MLFIVTIIADENITMIWCCCSTDDNGNDNNDITSDEQDVMKSNANDTSNDCDVNSNN